MAEIGIGGHDSFQPFRNGWPFLAAGLVFRNDSGITHLAALCGLKTFAIFGPGDPVLWSPWGKDVTVIRSESSTWPSVQAVWEGICVNRP
ncbi:MAG: hypothetical protein IPI28_06315 [Candidatus Omnitrophica bacterium]|nr:hypothetical protein [Candidatus Omnitrophota bacterium]